MPVEYVILKYGILYYAVPYSHDYYDQYAIFMVKKYYYIPFDADVFEDKKLTKKAGKLNKNGWFELLKQGTETGIPHKIKAGNKIYYIKGSYTIY